MPNTAGELRGKLINCVPLRTPSHGRADVGRLARSSQQKLCTDTGCGLEDLPNAMDDRDERRERERQREREREIESQGNPCSWYDMMMI